MDEASDAMSSFQDFMLNSGYIEFPKQESKTKPEDDNFTLRGAL